MVTVQRVLASGMMVAVQEYWPVVRWLQYKNIGQCKMVTVQKILASGKVVTVQEYWPVVRWLQYKNIGQW